MQRNFEKHCVHGFCSVQCFTNKFVQGALFYPDRFLGFPGNLLGIAVIRVSTHTPPKGAGHLAQLSQTSPKRTGWCYATPISGPRVVRRALASACAPSPSSSLLHSSEPYRGGLFAKLPSLLVGLCRHHNLTHASASFSGTAQCPQQCHSHQRESIHILGARE